MSNKRINEIDWKKSVKKALKDEENLLRKEAEAREKALTHEFEEGKVYVIKEVSTNRYSGGTTKKDGGKLMTNGISWCNDCLFRYVGKTGIHHCFIEQNGGWSRTYTDQQLIGKRITEFTEKMKNTPKKSSKKSRKKITEVTESTTSRLKPEACKSLD